MNMSALTVGHWIHPNGAKDLADQKPFAMPADVSFMTPFPYMFANSV